MDISKLASGFWKTSGHLKSAVIGASGWDVNILDARLASGKQVFIYFHDRATKFTWMASVPIDAFLGLTAKAMRLSESEIKMARDGLQSFAVKAAKKGIEHVKNDPVEEYLGASIVLYAGTTQTLKYVDGMKNGGHFIVINYRKSKDSNSGMLRPFVSPASSETPLSVDDLNTAIEYVILSDEEHHPDWFR